MPLGTPASYQVHIVILVFRMFWLSGDFLGRYFQFFLFFFSPVCVLFIMKTLENEQYIVVKAYKFTAFEILRDFFIIILYCVSTISLY